MRFFFFFFFLTSDRRIIGYSSVDDIFFFHYLWLDGIYNNSNNEILNNGENSLSFRGMD